MKGSIAQMVEQETENFRVDGSTPSRPTITTKENQMQVDSYVVIPCDECRALYRSKDYKKVQEDGRLRVNHLVQIGDTVVIGPKGYDINMYFQCPKCGEIWHGHKDLDPGGRSWSMDILSHKSHHEKWCQTGV